HDFRLQGTPGDNLAHARQAQDGLAVMLDQPLDGHEPSRLFLLAFRVPPCSHLRRDLIEAMFHHAVDPNRVRRAPKSGRNCRTLLALLTTRRVRNAGVRYTLSEGGL